MIEICNQISFYFKCLERERERETGPETDKINTAMEAMGRKICPPTDFLVKNSPLKVVICPCREHLQIKQHLQEGKVIFIKKMVGRGDRLTTCPSGPTVAFNKKSKRW